MGGSTRKTEKLSKSHVILKIADYDFFFNIPSTKLICFLASCLEKLWEGEHVTREQRWQSLLLLLF